MILFLPPFALAVTGFHPWIFTRFFSAIYLPEVSQWRIQFPHWENREEENLSALTPLRLFPSLLSIKLLGRMCPAFCWLLQLVFILSPLQSGLSPKCSEAPFVTKFTNALLTAKYVTKALSRPPGYRSFLKHLHSPEAPSTVFLVNSPLGPGIFLVTRDTNQQQRKKQKASLLALILYSVTTTSPLLCCNFPHLSPVFQKIKWDNIHKTSGTQTVIQTKSVHFKNVLPWELHFVATYLTDPIMFLLYI